MHSANETNARLNAAHARAVHNVLRCVHRLLGVVGRNHERCGKASCARSRRCRGFACEPGAATAGASRRRTAG